jgi:hypothetical protein
MRLFLFVTYYSYLRAFPKIPVFVFKTWEKAHFKRLKWKWLKYWKATSSAKKAPEVAKKALEVAKIAQILAKILKYAQKALQVEALEVVTCYNMPVGKLTLHCYYYYGERA